MEKDPWWEGFVEKVHFELGLRSGESGDETGEPR